ncbi:amino acid adenylation domain-containing protein, partial [Pseudoalteromonas sp. SMS1]|uniref:non-ribosomal peptide synthetase n=1 Tax=Pseudoalteromonas sp. SMS1 TaxID=2908894 RepID=UPI001F17BBCA
LTTVFSQIIARHEVLRSVYTEVDGQTLQHIRAISDVDFTIKVHDVSTLTGEAQNDAVMATVEADIVAPFNLAEELMLRVNYIQTGDETGVLVFNMHHIASDGWSMEVLTNEFFALYDALSQGQTSPLPALDIQYVDYAHWQRTHLEGEVLDKQLAYWEKQLDEVPPVHSLPLSYPRPDSKQHVGAIVHSSLPADVATRLQALAKQHQLTPFMLLHGALSLLLARHSNSADIVIGTPVANRLQDALTPLIGFFVNTQVLRANTDHATLADYFKHIRQVHVDAQANQDVPFEQLVERLKIPRSTAHTPLFQIMMTTETDYGLSQGESSTEISGVEITPYDAQTIQTKFDLSIDLSMSDAGVGISWTYDVSLFDAQSIERLNDHLCRLLRGLSEVNDGTVRPYHLPMLSQSEQQHLLTALNETASDYPKDSCLHELVEQQAAINPDRIAVVFEDQQLTFKALNERANQLAHCLVETQGVTPDTLVGLCAERSLEMVVGMLGIMKAGGAYVPLDPSYPDSRLAYMIEDGDINTIVSHTPVSHLLSDFKGTVIELDKDDAHLAFSTDNITKSAIGLSSANLVYVIYTSGSTGKPKGVMVEHQAVFNRIHWMCNKFSMTAEDKVLQKTPYSFDVSVWEFMWPLATGAQLVMAKPGGHRDPEYLCALIQQHKITQLHFVPSMLGVILESDSFKKCTSIKQAFCSGEALQLNHVQGFYDAIAGAQLHNLYGPTEAAIEVSHWDCSGDAPNGVPIGHPLHNIQLVVLDKHLNPVPKGVTGELHIGGDCLARGYLNRPDLTQASFIDNPYHDESNPSSSPRLYKTGDLARLRADNAIEYQGRVDHQVKIRGLRIELGEVETQLGAQAGVDSALVLAKELAGSQQLVGYVKAKTPLDEAAQLKLVSEIKVNLLAELPDYMVPSILLVVSEWPLTVNGKIDRKSLPEPDSSAALFDYVAPETETERVLVDIWAELLGADPDKLSTTANFFELGGHSLMIVRSVALIKQKLEVTMEVAAMFDSANIQMLAETIDSKKLKIKFTQVETEVADDEMELVI